MSHVVDPGPALLELMELAHAGARARGWHDGDTTFAEQMALVHSEVSEALEEYRHNYPVTEARLTSDGKPLGVPIELADVVIRVCEIAARYDIDLVSAVRTKLAWNATRSYRHGGKRL